MIYPKSKDIINLLGSGLLITAAIIAPGIGKAAIKSIRARELKQRNKEWLKYNSFYLRRNINRLQNQKMIEIINKERESVFKLTNKGQTKYLKTIIEDLSLDEEKWDGKWRIVVYDISTLKRSIQNQLRLVLKQMKFLQLQKSVYLTPYSCQDEIDYLKAYFGLGKEVVIIEATNIENQDSYKNYFGL